MNLSQIKHERQLEGVYRELNHCLRCKYITKDEFIKFKAWALSLLNKEFEAVKISQILTWKNRCAYSFIIFMEQVGNRVKDIKEYINQQYDYLKETL